MITAQEAKELSNSANGYYEQIEFYKEKVEQEIREAANKGKNAIIFIVKEDFNIGREIASILVNEGFIVYVGSQPKLHILNISW